MSFKMAESGDDGMQFKKVSPEDRWVDIQQRTFTNWVNEHLLIGGRSITSLSTDLCDGVNLVALVESLQFRKLGKVYQHPSGMIQKIQNVSLACKAITEDNVKLVNIGNEDIVNGNLKLILGLIWHLIVRYQISTRKSKSPPKKLMMNWFKMSLPDLDLGNFTSDWEDGVALHALMDYLKPGISPNWRELHSKDKVDNCRSAMVLAKEHFNIPRMISPEDFASGALDELSAMTYLSYFVKVESPGYYDTLNWVCKQLRTTTITNLTTDWNDGQKFCAIVNSLGGTIPGWPDLNKEDHVGNCQKAINGGKELGVDPVLTAEEMADATVDHLSIMTYLNRFKHAKPKKSDNEKFDVKISLENVLTGVQCQFKIKVLDKDVSKDKLRVEVKGPSSKPDCDLHWKEKFQCVECKFTPKEAGEHQISAYYNEVLLSGCPVEFKVRPDVSKVRIVTQSGTYKVGTKIDVKVSSDTTEKNSVTMEVKTPKNEIRNIVCPYEDGAFVGDFQPKSAGLWTVHVYYADEELAASPLVFDIYDPKKSWMSGPQQGVVGEAVIFTVNYAEAGTGDIVAEVTHSGKSFPCDVTDDEESEGVKRVEFTPESSGLFYVHVKFNDQPISGSPKSVDVKDPGQIRVVGEGLTHGVIGRESQFQVSTGDLGGNIKVNIDVEGVPVDTAWTELSSSTYQFTYIPDKAGNYNIKVLWDDRQVTGSPFRAKVTDRSRVTLMTDLADLKDENDHLALECDMETCLHYNIGSAGPGNLTAEVLAPSGKLPVDQRKPSKDEVELAFTAKEEGDHYIHLYWSDVPLDSSPILAYCPGPILPVDHTKVVITGKGREEARANVPAEFMVDGKKAGPGVPKVVIKGVKKDPIVDMKALKYDRYKCTYDAPFPGGYVLFVHWSDQLVPDCPYKITVSTKGAGDKVKVSGPGLKGGYVGQELRVIVDTTDAGYGEIKVDCKGQLHDTRFDMFDQKNGIYTLRIYPEEACKHTLSITYDCGDVPGSPFHIPIGEPPDPRKVVVEGPGIEDGLLHKRGDQFLVHTAGAGAGQLAVRIRGPKGAFKVDVKRESDNDRTVICKYSPEEEGQYIISVRWSGNHVRGSPFKAHLFENKEKFITYLKEQMGIEISDIRSRTKAAPVQWRDEI